MKRMHNSLLGYLLITPPLLGCLLFYAIPFVLVVLPPLFLFTYFNRELAEVK